MIIPKSRFSVVLLLGLHGRASALRIAEMLSPLWWRCSHCMAVLPFSSRCWQSDQARPCRLFSWARGEVWSSIHCQRRHGAAIAPVAQLSIQAGTSCLLIVVVGQGSQFRGR